MELSTNNFSDGKEDLSKLKCRLIDVCHRYISGETIPNPIIDIKTEQGKNRYEILKKYISEFESKININKL